MARTRNITIKLELDTDSVNAAGMAIHRVAKALEDLALTLVLANDSEEPPTAEQVDETLQMAGAVVENHWGARCGECGRGLSALGTCDYSDCGAVQTHRRIVDRPQA